MGKGLRFCGAIFVLLVLSAVFHANLTLADTAPQTQAQTEYILGPGDKVRVTVFRNDDLTGESEVDPSGFITLPLIQQVPAGGKTIPQLEAEIKKRLSPDYVKNPNLSIEVLNYRPFYIIGEVKNPGSYPFVANMTVVNAIALAGGYTYRANKDEVIITRAADTTRKPVQALRTDIVLPGDVIEVKERLF